VLDGVFFNKLTRQKSITNTLIAKILLTKRPNNDQKFGPLRLNCDEKVILSYPTEVFFTSLFTAKADLKYTAYVNDFLQIEAFAKIHKALHLKNYEIHEM